MSSNKQIAPKKPAKKNTTLPPELRQIVIDTKRYKNKTSSTEILETLRYKSA